MLKSYGITLSEYRSLLQKQDSRCAICGQIESAINWKTKEKKSLAVDHCHSTGKVRGLLCQSCNTALGSFNDDVSLLAKAIAYLSNNQP
jgi:hypothetical protein